jgi:hypothetical protein
MPSVQMLMPGANEQTRSVTHGVAGAPAIGQRQNRRWVFG